MTIRVEMGGWALQTCQETAHKKEVSKVGEGGIAGRLGLRGGRM